MSKDIMRKIKKVLDFIVRIGMRIAVAYFVFPALIGPMMAKIGILPYLIKMGLFAATYTKSFIALGIAVMAIFAREDLFRVVRDVLWQLSMEFLIIIEALHLGWIICNLVLLDSAKVIFNFFVGQDYFVTRVMVACDPGKYGMGQPVGQPVQVYVIPPADFSGPSPQSTPFFVPLDRNGSFLNQFPLNKKQSAVDSETIKLNGHVGSDQMENGRFSRP